MGRYILKRAIMSIAIIYVVVTIAFFMIRLMPGNAVDALYAQLVSQGGLTPVQIDQRIQAVYGLSPKGSNLTQYFEYISNALRGDLGYSIVNPDKSVASIIANSLPWTIFIVAVSLLISFVIGIIVGTVMAVFRDSRVGKFLTFLSSLLSSVPNYLAAIALIYFLIDLHPVFPLGGAYSAEITPGLNVPFIKSVFMHAVLPVVAYVITGFGGWALTMKGSVTTILGADYVRAAQSWGLSKRRVTQSYIGRNSLLPMVTSLALSLGYMFGGSVFIETFFSYPGLGYYLVNAVSGRDYPLMMGCFILITAAVVISNFAVDVLYPFVDPRIAKVGGPKREATGAREAATEDMEEAGPVGSTVA